MYSAFGVDHGEISKRMKYVKETMSTHGPILNHTVISSRPNGIFTNAKVKATTESRHIGRLKGKKSSNTIGGGLNNRGKYTVGGAAGLTAGGAGGAIGHKHKKKITDSVSKAGFRLPGSSAFRGGGAQTGGGQGVSAGLMKPQKPTFQGGPQKSSGAAGAFAGGPKKPQQNPMQAFAAARQKRMGMQKKPGAGLSSAPSAGFGASKPSFSGGTSFGQSR